MKYTIEQITTGEDELILKYRQMNSEVEAVMNFMKLPNQKLVGLKEDKQVVIPKDEILYVESVDGKSFVYTTEDVFQVPFSLVQMENVLNAVNFFRCSKSMMINIDKVRSLKSLASNRIDATMCNGERILISRTYASEFRRILKGGRNNEG